MAASLCTKQVLNNKLGEILRRHVCLKHVNNFSYCKLLFSIGGKIMACQPADSKKVRYPNHASCRTVATVDNLRPLKFVINESNKLSTSFNEVNLNVISHILHSGKNSCFNKDRGKRELAKSQIRWNSSGNPEKNLPPLMDFPEIIWPNVLKTIKNKILSSFIITPYFDKEFRLSEFVQGSKQALQCVSSYLSRGDYNALEGLVTADALKEVKTNITAFSVDQRHDLFVDKEDIYFSFPYQIGIMFNDDDKNQQRFVEITMVYHVLHGLKEMKAQDINPPLNLGMLPEYQDKLHLCNYRFIREFTKGVESDWTVNVLNHFKPVDNIRQ